MDELNELAHDWSGRDCGGDSLRNLPASEPASMLPRLCSAVPVFLLFSFQIGNYASFGDWYKNTKLAFPAGQSGLADVTAERLGWAGLRADAAAQVGRAHCQSQPATCRAHNR